MTINNIAACPIVVGINVDTEALDAANAGKGGLFGRHSYGRYGAREGVTRLLTEFDKLGVVATFFVIPEDASRHPYLLEKIIRQGHEIAVRGGGAFLQNETVCLEKLAEEKEALEKITGATVSGWRSIDGLITENTLPALAKLGYVYESSAKDDDTPYVMHGPQGTLVELPTFDYLTDSTFYANRHTDQRTRKAWEEEAAAQYCAGGYVNLTLHTRGDIGSSRLPRVQNVGDFLRSMLEKPGVSAYTAKDLAQGWLQQRRNTEPFPQFLRPNI